MNLHDNLHLFVKCKHTRLFWLKFGDIIRKLYNVNFFFDKFVLIEGYNLKNKIFKSLNFLIIYAKYAVYLTFMQAENCQLMFHEVSILCIFKRLIHNRLKIEKNCKTKNLCIFENTVIQENETCFIWTMLRCFDVISIDCVWLFDLFKSIYLSINSFYKKKKKKKKKTVPWIYPNWYLNFKNFKALFACLEYIFWWLLLWKAGISRRET